VKETELAVEVRNIRKVFRLPHEQHSGIKQKIINLFKGVKGYEEQEVLKDISFEVRKGEFFGVVGRNGSGKSTLLKILAEIYTPNKGKVTVNGSLIPFIELGVGFNPELTGRENIFLNGALLGFSRKEMEEKYDSIVKFSELERFMDQKLKNYSSGMQVRLAFSIAIRAHGDILLLDEVLAVGDAAFQKKCFDYFTDLKKEKRTVILVSHDMNAVRKFCERAVLIEKGKVILVGTSEEVGNAYEDMFIRDTLNQSTDSGNASSSNDIFENKNFSVVSCAVNNNIVVKPTDNISIATKLVTNIDIDKSIDYGINIFNKSGVLVFATGTKVHKQTIKGGVKKGQEISFIHNIDNHLTDDTYHINIALKYADKDDLLLKQSNVTNFTVRGWELKHSLVQSENELKVSVSV